MATGAQAQLRARALAIVAGEYGVTGYRFNAGRFTVAAVDTTPDRSEARERVADVMFDPEAIIDHRPQCSLKIYAQRMAVTVAYVVTGAGDDIDAEGYESGAGDIGAVEDRAAQDGHELGAVLGYQPQWTGLSGLDVINATPAIDAQPTAQLSLNGRTYTRTTYIDFTIRAGSPGSLGPST